MTNGCWHILWTTQLADSTGPGGCAVQQVRICSARNAGDLVSVPAGAMRVLICFHDSTKGDFSTAWTLPNLMLLGLGRASASFVTAWRPGSVGTSEARGRDLIVCAQASGQHRVLANSARTTACGPFFPVSTRSLRTSDGSKPYTKVSTVRCVSHECHTRADIEGIACEWVAPQTSV